MACENHNRIEAAITEQHKVNLDFEKRLSKLEGWIKANTTVSLIGFISILLAILFK